jgi:hypothetical protein
VSLFLYLNTKVSIINLRCKFECDYFLHNHFIVLKSSSVIHFCSSGVSPLYSKCIGSNEYLNNLITLGMININANIFFILYRLNKSSESNHNITIREVLISAFSYISTNVCNHLIKVVGLIHLDITKHSK